MLNEIEALAVETGAAVAFGAHYSKGNQAGKEVIDRIGGSGVFARDPDSILNFTRHEEERLLHCRRDVAKSSADKAFRCALGLSAYVRRFFVRSRSVKTSWRGRETISFDRTARSPRATDVHRRIQKDGQNGNRNERANVLPPVRRTKIQRRVNTGCRRQVEPEMNPSLLPTLPTHCQRCRWHYRHCHAATLPPPFRVAAAAVPVVVIRDFRENCQPPLAVNPPGRRGASEWYDLSSNPFRCRIHSQTWQALHDDESRPMGPAVTKCLRSIDTAAQMAGTSRALRRQKDCPGCESLIRSGAKAADALSEKRPGNE